MTKKALPFLALLLVSFFTFAQEVNTDEIYFKALEEYRSGNYNASLELTSKGLKAAPLYHDIRILRVRNRFALDQFESAAKDIEFLLKEAPNYEGVRTIALQRLHQMPPGPAFSFAALLLQTYPVDPEIKIRKANLLMETGEHAQARELAMEIFTKDGLTAGQKYELHQLLDLTVKDAVQINGQYIDFSDEYSYRSWYAISAEFQHNFRKMSLIGRVTYADRSYNSGNLYEIEAYPKLSEKLYAFVNLGFSKGEIFPDFRSSASIFYNFAPSFEAEAGFRNLSYGQTSYLSGILGLTTYTGKFYLNARAFIGPERLEQVLQNYQFNVRYYLNTPENYLFARLGSGFSPDEPAVYTQALEDPTLEALYFSAGINKSFGIHHVVSLSGGILTEDLPSGATGNQVTATLGYRYKF